MSKSFLPREPLDLPIYLSIRPKEPLPTSSTQESRTQQRTIQELSNRHIYVRHFCRADREDSPKEQARTDLPKADPTGGGGRSCRSSQHSSPVSPFCVTLPSQTRLSAWILLFNAFIRLQCGGVDIIKRRFLVALMGHAAFARILAATYANGDWQRRRIPPEGGHFGRIALPLGPGRSVFRRGRNSFSLDQIGRAVFVAPTLNGLSNVGQTVVVH